MHTCHHKLISRQWRGPSSRSNTKLVMARCAIKDHGASCASGVASDRAQWRWGKYVGTRKAPNYSSRRSRSSAWCERLCAVCIAQQRFGSSRLRYSHCKRLVRISWLICSAWLTISPYMPNVKQSCLKTWRCGEGLLTFIRARERSWHTHMKWTNMNAN